VHPSPVDLDHEEHVEAAQRHGIYREEVRGQDPVVSENSMCPLRSEFSDLQAEGNESRGSPA
jgi:hypothetical protein